MATIGRPDGRSLLLFGAGALLVLGSIGVFPQIPGTEYHASVEPVDEEEGKNVSEIVYMAYQFEELSAEAQWQFRAARNSSGNRITFEEEAKKAPEFGYGDHQATVAYVLYEDEYYLMATESSSCFAAVCAFLRWRVGFVALVGAACIVFALWQSIEREG